MPIYEWYCSACCHEEETLQEINDPAPFCTKCCDKGEKMKRKISKSSFILKGEGWFKDGYSKKSRSKG